jgi:type VI secretion system protein ImpE
MSATDLFRDGQLDEALAAAADAVKKAPTDPAARLLLAELLCFTGDLERADNHFDALTGAEPQLMTWALSSRQILRAEQARRDFYASGRVPTLLAPAEGAVRHLLEASVQARGGDGPGAAALAERAEAERVHPRGNHAGLPFEDFRDLDDLTASVLEVLTSKGDYYWIPLDRVESIEFQPPARPRDLIWRRASLVVRDGPDSEVFIPALYAGTSSESDDTLRLGRQTDWRGGDGTPVRGVGQRTFLVGDVDVPILELTDLTFEPAAP